MKHLAAQVIQSDSVTIQSTDGVQQVKVDQAGAGTVQVTAAGNASVVANHVVLRSTDNAQVVDLDQAGAGTVQVTAAGSTNVTSSAIKLQSTDNAQKVEVDQAVGVTITASGVGRNASLLSNSHADTHILSDGDGTDGILIEIPRYPVAIQLAPSGDIFDFVPNGNEIITASEFVVNSVIAEINGSLAIEQTALTLTGNATVDPANPNYNTLTDVEAPGLRTASRLYVAPDAAGTTIRSIILHTGDQNPPRVLWIQNVGTSPGQTLTLPAQDPAGTVGGQFFGPGDYTIPAGGGVAVVFDDQLAPGFFMVSGV